VISIYLKDTPLGSVLYAKCDTFAESKWLGEAGWFFLGDKTDPELREKLASLPLKCRWLPENKFPVAAQIWGKPRILWSPEASAVVAPKAEAQALSGALDAEIDIPAPEGLEYRPYQKAGVAAAIRAFSSGRNGILLGDEMGLGKTMQAIGTMRLLDATSRVLVVCPASLRTNWQREIERWWPEVESPRILNGSLPRTDQNLPFVPPLSRVTILNYDKATGQSWDADLLKDALSRAVFDLVIFDEAHFLKNPKAQRTIFFFGAYKAGRLIEPGVIHNCKTRLLLTGTPIQNRIVESIPLLRAIDAFGESGITKSEKTFLFRYCGPQKIKTKKKTITHFSGATRLDELQAKLRSGFMVRRLKRDVEKELPPKIRSVIILNNKQTDLVMERPAVLDEVDDFREAVARLTRGPADFNEMSALRARIAKAKTADVVAFLQDLEDVKMLVFFHHRVLLDAIEKAFSPHLIRIDGSTPPEKRQGLVDKFQTDPKIRLALLSTHAAGIGLTLTAAQAEVFAESDWNPSWAVQAEDRAHRIGQEAERLPIYYLVLDRTIDAHVISTMVRKMDIADRALDAKPHTFEKDDGPPVTTVSKEEYRAVRSVTIINGKGETEILITDARKNAVMGALKYMSGRCDGAQKLDNVGFNGYDAHDPFVQKLIRKAFEGDMSDKQAAYGLKILYKYRQTQLSRFAGTLFPETKEAVGG
jgi:superfamily II DNA or RNA helicase